MSRDFCPDQQAPLSLRTSGLTQEALAERTGLVTLTGPSGVGKTRLAQQVADDLREAFDDGVSLGELAEVRDADTPPPPSANGTLLIADVQVERVAAGE